MSNELVIVESPTKARTITRFLPASFQVTASNGHIRDLPERRLAIDVKNQFAPEYEITPSRQGVIKQLKEAVKKASAVYLATDPDREGEAIAWHIYEVLKSVNRKVPYHRVAFHEITRTAVQHAVDHPGELDMNRVDAQQARRVLDRLVGYQVSKLLWSQVERGTSAGRVQSVALRLICEREKQIRDFEPQEYWNLVAHFLKQATREGFDTRLVEVDGQKADVTNAEQAESLATDAERGEYAVSNVQKQPRQRRPSPPFITSTLQQAASANIHMSPQQTMKVAQELYEGVDTGNGPVGLITYMRTDSVNVAREAQQAARDFIASEFGQDYIPDKPNNYRSRNTAQEAHEAIRPTDVTLTPERAARYLDDRQTKLYRLIYNRFMASQMAPARELRTTVELDNVARTSLAGAPGPIGSQHVFLFRATSTVVTFPGFLKVYNLHDTEDEDEKDGTLPELAKGDACLLNKLDREQKFTEPPPRFSEATLVRELEKNGIGRPSTYASIVNTIQQRKYVHKEKGRLVPTDLGFTVSDYLVARMPNLFDVTFTARMEDQLDAVENGDQEWHAMLEQFYGRFTDWLKSARQDGQPEDGSVQKVMAAFPADLPWEEPAKRGKRTYDDKKFFTSLQDQLDKQKPLSGKQWQALLQMAVKYRQNLPPLDSLCESDDDRKLLQQCLDTHQQKASETPAEETLRMMAAMNAIAKWEEPVTRGKRTYDDHQFFSSLKEQAESGRKLSPAQLTSLKRLLVKYRDQIPEFESLQGDVELPKAPERADVGKDKIDVLLDMAKEIKEFDPPRQRGRRTYDDREFIDSIARQHRQGRTLSQPQWSALQTVLGKYAKQIPDFADRLKAAGIEAAAAKQAPPTDVTCPQCNEGKLQQRRSRRGTFYGCNRYPTCKYATNSLENLKPPAKQ